MVFVTAKYWENDVEMGLTDSNSDVKYLFQHSNICYGILLQGNDT